MQGWFLVSEQIPSVEAIARQIIDQCRRDVAAAMLQLDGARAILVGSRWLLARWEERRRADAISGGIRLRAYDEGRASGFVAVEQPKQRRRRRLLA